MKFPHILINPTHLQCDLTIGDWPVCKGIQKIIGFGRGFAHHRVEYFPYFHHSNSIRLGYNRSQGEDFVRLFMYAYVNKNRVEKLIGDFKIETEIQPKLYWLKSLIAIEIYKNHSNFSSHDVCHPRLNPTFPIGYLLRPYAEIDGPDNIRTKFDVGIRNLKIA